MRNYLALSLSFLTLSAVASPNPVELRVKCAPEAGVYAMAQYAQGSGASEDMLDVVSVTKVGTKTFAVEVSFENGTDLEFAYYDVTVNGRCALRSIVETARD